MRETRSRMTRKKMSLLSENCNSDVQAKATSGHENAPNGCAEKVSMNQLAWFTLTESGRVEEGKSVGKKNGYDTEDSEEESISKSEGDSISSEDIANDMNGIKPRSFYSSQNQRQQTKSRKQFLQRNQPKTMADKPLCNHSKTTSVKRKQDRYSAVVPAKKARNSERYSSNGRTFRDKVFGKRNGQLNGKLENRRQTRSSFCKSFDRKLCNGTENGATEYLGKESAKMQEDLLFSDNDSSDMHSSHQAFSNGLSNSDLSCSEGSVASGPGAVSSDLLWETNGTEHTDSAESSGFTESGNNREHKEGSVSDEDKTMVDSKERESLQKIIPMFPSPSLTRISFSPVEDSESTSNSAKSSPENQASITKYFKSLPGQMSKNSKLSKRNGGALYASPVGAGKKPKSRSPHSRKSRNSRGLEQMYLDLGQKDFGHVTCQTCGMVYTKAQPDDEAEHIKHHKRFVSGLKFMGWKNERVVQEFHDGRVIMVTPDDHTLHTKKVEEIRKVVDAELGFASDPPFRKHESKTFLFISNKRVVGCAVAIQIDKGYPVLPNNSKDSTPDRQLAAWCCSSTPQPAQCGISRIWVFSPFRRKKIATRLIECVRTNFIYGCIILKEKLAFSDPTPDGKRLAQSYAGTSQFLVFR